MQAYCYDLSPRERTRREHYAKASIFFMLVQSYSETVEWKMTIELVTGIDVSRWKLLQALSSLYVGVDVWSRFSPVRCTVPFFNGHV